jgi:regulator of replication initiation timing
VSENDKYLIQLRRELVRAQAQLKRAESECDRLRLENQRLKELVKASAKTLDRQS